MRQKFTEPLSRNIIYYIFGLLSSILFDWPLLGDLIRGGAGSQYCIECPQVDRVGVFRQIPAIDSKLAVH